MNSTKMEDAADFWEDAAEFPEIALSYREKAAECRKMAADYRRMAEEYNWDSDKAGKEGLVCDEDGDSNEAFRCYLDAQKLGGKAMIYKDKAEELERDAEELELEADEMERINK